MMTCPKCAYERKSIDTAPDYECPACGSVYAKYDSAKSSSSQINRQDTTINRASGMEKRTGKFVAGSLISGEYVVESAIVSWLSQNHLFITAVIFLLLPLETHVVFAGVVFVVGIAIMNVLSTELAITNKKIIGKTGFIRRESIDLPLKKLESINIDQNMAARILGYGTVSIRGIGGNHVTIPWIKNPMAFRRVVMDIIDEKEDSNVYATQ